MAARKGKEFFEAFQRPQGYRPQPTPPAPAPAQPKTVPRPGAAAPGTRPAKPAVYTLTRGQLKLIGAGVGVLILIAFLLGWSLRSRPAKTSSSSQPSASPATKSAPSPTKGTTSDPSTASKPKFVYRLQLISGISEESARELGAYLRQLKYDPTPIKTRNANTYTIYVGEFDSLDSPEARGFQDKFRNMVYKGKQDFRDCFLVQRKKD